MAGYSAPQFLHIFDLPLLRGDAERALDNPSSVIVSEKTALNLFGSVDVLERTITQDGIDLTITGVLGPLPQPTSIGPDARLFGTPRFDVLMSENAIPACDPAASFAREDWLSPRNFTYVLFRPDGAFSAEDLNRDFPAFKQRHVPADMQISFVAKPLSIFGFATIDFVSDQIGVPIKVLILVLGGIILAIACVNYANLAVAQSIGRVYEIGLRKVLGASREQLIFQYFLEAALLTAFACLIAMTFLLLLSPVFSAITGPEVVSFLSQTTSFWGGLAVVFTAVTIAAGFYPALVLSRPTPLGLMREGEHNLGRRAGLNILVVTQFALASLLLVAVFVFSAQKTALLDLASTVTNDPVVIINNMKSARLTSTRLRKN